MDFDKQMENLNSTVLRVEVKPDRVRFVCRQWHITVGRFCALSGQRRDYWLIDFDPLDFDMFGELLTKF